MELYYWYGSTDDVVSIFIWIPNPILTINLLENCWNHTINAVPSACHDETAKLIRFHLFFEEEKINESLF